MSVVQIPENMTHQANIARSEMIRQVSVAAAGNNQASVRTAELLHARTCLASAIANKCGVSQWTSMLQELGVQT